MPSRKLSELKTDGRAFGGEDNAKLLKLIGSICSVGLLCAIDIDENNKVIDGRFRVAAYNLLNKAEIEVRVVKNHPGAPKVCGIQDKEIERLKKTLAEIRLKLGATNPPNGPIRAVVGELYDTITKVLEEKTPQEPKKRYKTTFYDREGRKYFTFDFDITAVAIRERNLKMITHTNFVKYETEEVPLESEAGA